MFDFLPLLLHYVMGIDSPFTHQSSQRHHQTRRQSQSARTKQRVISTHPVGSIAVFCRWSSPLIHGNWRRNNDLLWLLSLSLSLRVGGKSSTLLGEREGVQEELVLASLMAPQNPQRVHRQELVYCLHCLATGP